MNKVKELGQVMTPIEIVNHMIDLLSLTEEQIKTCSFVDNSCGDGIFIKELLKRGVPSNHIFACDIDEEISQGVKQLIPEKNFYFGSAFDKVEWFNKFDYVIGNPPYVRIHNIEESMRNFLKKNYIFCFGMFDLYLAFYELGLKMLKPNGTLLYISPNSFCKSASGKKMREYIEQNKLLRYFEDFENTKKFDNYSTYTCIMKLSFNEEKEIFPPWIIKREQKHLSFSSLQNGIATLADKIFISDDFSFLEPDLIHPILKASTGEKKFVIVPPKTEEELQEYPKTYEYLKKNEEKLRRRSLTGNTKWFEFGRTQGLINMRKEKIAISTTMPWTGMKIYRLPAEYYVYSGLYATATNLDKLEEELKSEDLLAYLIENGKPMSGDYTQINSTLLKKY